MDSWSRDREVEKPKEKMVERHARLRGEARKQQAELGKVHDALVILCGHQHMPLAREILVNTSTLIDQLVAELKGH
jgi:predicted phosphodiesterase